MELRLREGVLEPRLPMGKKILIENLPKSFHSDDLKNLFTPYGTVLAAKDFLIACPTDRCVSDMWKCRPRPRLFWLATTLMVALSMNTDCL